MTADRARLVQELRGVMALVDRATPNEWLPTQFGDVQRTKPDGTRGSLIVSGSGSSCMYDGWKHNAEAIAAAVNFLRDNSEAIAAAIEGAGVEELRAEVERLAALHVGYAAQVFTLTNRAERLAEALRVMLDRYVSLINSGDAGNWNPEEEPQVIAARAALAASSADGEG